MNYAFFLTSNVFLKAMTCPLLKNHAFHCLKNSLDYSFPLPSSQDLALLRTFLYVPGAFSIKKDKKINTALCNEKCAGMTAKRVGRWMAKVHYSRAGKYGKDK